MRNRNDSDKAVEEFLKKLLAVEMPNIKRDEQKAYHITITDNKTGEKKIDSDTDCVVGGYSINDEKGVAISISACNLATIIGTAQTAQTAVKEITADKPLAKLLLKLGE